MDDPLRVEAFVFNDVAPHEGVGAGLGFNKIRSGCWGGHVSRIDLLIWVWVGVGVLVWYEGIWMRSGGGVG